MSHAELQIDQTATYDALLRLIEADRTGTKAFRKLTERLQWVNAEMIKAGFMNRAMDDARAIREAWL